LQISEIDSNGSGPEHKTCWKIFLDGSQRSSSTVAVGGQQCKVAVNGKKIAAMKAAQKNAEAEFLIMGNFDTKLKEKD